MSHHLAEQLHQARHAEGADRQAAEDRAVALILKIWASRRDAPGNVDPLRRLENVIAVLDRMRPEAWPFRGWDDGNIPQLLTKAFDGLRTVVWAGVLMTQWDDQEPVDAGAASGFLEKDEQEIIDRLNAWVEFIDQMPDRPSRPRIVFTDEQAAALEAEDRREAEINAMPEPARALIRLDGHLEHLIKTLEDLRTGLAERKV